MSAHDGTVKRSALEYNIKGAETDPTVLKGTSSLYTFLRDSPARSKGGYKVTVSNMKVKNPRVFINITCTYLF